MKKFISVLLIFILVFASTISFANPKDQYKNMKIKDLDPSGWYYNSVMKMIEYNIITGYDDDTFRPNDFVKRSEYAALLVRSLKIPVDKHPISSFVDLKNSDWETKYVEAAKYYLTGYKSVNGNLFKSNSYTLREDIMVALVKALGYDISETNLDILDEYEDSNLISKNLRTYVAAAIEQGLVNGYETHGKKYIKPMQKITRAETAKLLFSVIESEKITFDEDEKIIFDDTTEINDMVRIYSSTFNNKITLKWEEIDNPKVKGYKVVASKNDRTPTYPEDGYYKYIQNDNDVDIIAYTTYNGDLKKLYPNTYYYFNVNVLYDDGSVVPSNTLKLKIPDNTDYDKDLSLEVEINEEGNGFELKWDEYEGGNLKYYKVVASSTVDDPTYPENGYYKYFTNPEDTECTILLGEGYNGGDISAFKKDTEYNFRITVVKNNGLTRAFTNTVSLEIPTINDETFDLSGTINNANDKFILEWDKYDENNFEKFKVVASSEVNNPTYPENYYAEYTTNNDDNRIEIPLDTTFNNEGSTETFEANQEYNFRIVVIKNDGSEKTYSNTVNLEIVQGNEITLTGAIVDNEFNLSWDEYIASDFDGYKVVASINDETPTYSENGYYQYITDNSTNEINIPLEANYNSGDFTSFVANQKYNFAITVLKNNGNEKTYSNTVNLEIAE